MSDLKIQKIWQCSFDSFLSSGHPVSDIQKKVSHAVMRCKSGALGANACQCTECGHTEFHNNSCRNRNCPNCQAVLKEIWVDKRREEVIDAPYFHVVFTLPHELNPLIYCNQKLLYGLFTDAVPKHFLNYLTIRSISVRHLASYRCSIHGTRRSATMCICTVLFLVAASHMTRRYAGQKTSFSFLSGYSGINLKGNIFPSLIPGTGKDRSFSLLPVKHSGIPMSGRSSKMIFTAKTGALT